METVGPLGDLCGVEIKTLATLREQGLFESHPRFRTRTARAVDSLQRDLSPLMIICSHGDWIPIAMEHLTGARLRLKKGGWIQVELTSPPRLASLRQTLP